MFGLDGEKQGRIGKNWSQADMYMTQPQLPSNTDKTQGSGF